ncbi:MAG: HTTM domain-containing protein [Bacteroidota bacterium]
MEQSVSIAPLVSYRIIFGLLMLISTIRYIWMGWIDSQLVDPILHFTYYGFEWVKVLPRIGMYAVFMVMALSSVGIILAAFYRLSR